MKESYIEGLATHDDLESCADDTRESPKVGCEALTEADIGWTLSREITQFWAPTLSPQAEGHAVMCEEGASTSPALRGLRTHACVETPCARTGRSTDRSRAEMEARAAKGRAIARSLR
jgi:hypothetical protein